MAFAIKRSPRDKKIFDDIHESRENIFTAGRGSYASFDTANYGSKYNILCGRFCSLAVGIVFLINGNHPIKSVTTYPFDVGKVIKDVFGEVRPNLHPLRRKRQNHFQVIIGNDVWLGRNVTIMGGVKIGNGAVIGANAVVAKDIPPYAIAVGNPVRVIKYRFDDETVRKLLAVKWWNWDLEKIADALPLMQDVEKFLETHYSPELEEFPEDEFTRQLEECTGGGYLSLYYRLPSAESAVA